MRKGSTTLPGTLSFGLPSWMPRWEGGFKEVMRDLYLKLEGDLRRVDRNVAVGKLF